MDAIQRLAQMAGQGEQYTLRFQNTLLTSAGLVVPQQVDGAESKRPPLGLLDLLSREPTSSDTIDYSWVSAETNAANVVAEGSATGAPEGSLSFLDASVKVESVQVSLSVSRKAVSDVRRLRNLLDLLVAGWVRTKLESQLCVGTGAGGQLLGLANVVGTQTETGGTTTLQRARLAQKVSLDSGGGEPSAYLMAGSTWFEHYDGEPFRAQPRVLHGLPVVLSSGVPDNTVWCGNWAQGTLHTRSESVSASNQHRDFYVRNLALVLAEVRAALSVAYPASLVKFAVV